jgi:hypothetical protein
MYKYLILVIVKSMCLGKQDFIGLIVRVVLFRKVLVTSPWTKKVQKRGRVGWWDGDGVSWATEGIVIVLGWKE